MGKSFSILLTNLNSKSRVYRFCDYYAKQVGFKSKEEMFKDTEYMKQCEVFSKAVEKSVDPRNNSSHGGIIISVEQCRADKNTVLNGFETDGRNNLGLMYQILCLICREATSEKTTFQP